MVASQIGSQPNSTLYPKEKLVKIFRLIAAALTSLLVFGIVGCGNGEGSDFSDMRGVGIHAIGCKLGGNRGSGLAVMPGLILTSAHVVAGATEIQVLFGDDKAEVATLVGFDPQIDLAYLRVGGLNLSDVKPPLIAGIDVKDGTSGRALVFRGGEVVEINVKVLRPVRIKTEDIYVEDEVTRPGFQILADIRLGDSGGAVVVDNKVIGLLWARTLSFDDELSYAINVSQARGLIDTQLTTGKLGPSIDPTRCS